MIYLVLLSAEVLVLPFKVNYDLPLAKNNIVN